MPYSISYQDDGGVVTTYSGVITDEELTQSARERTTPIEKVEAYRYLLSDFTGVTAFEVSSDGIGVAAREASRLIQQNPEIRVAIILPTDLEYGMGRMWQSRTKESDDKTMLVRTMEEARKWLEACL